MCTYVCVCEYACICLFLYVRACVCVCARAYVCVCVYVRARACMCIHNNYYFLSVHVCVCAHVCLCVKLVQRVLASHVTHLSAGGGVRVGDDRQRLRPCQTNESTQPWQCRSSSSLSSRTYLRHVAVCCDVALFYVLLEAFTHGTFVSTVRLDLKRSKLRRRVNGRNIPWQTRRSRS